MVAEPAACLLAFRTLLCVSNKMCRKGGWILPGLSQHLPSMVKGQEGNQLRTSRENCAVLERLNSGLLKDMSMS